MSSIYPINPSKKTEDAHIGSWSDDPDMKPEMDITTNANPVITVYPRDVVNRPVFVKIPIYL